MVMHCRIADLRCKEVVNVCSGFRLGFVSDVLVDTKCGKIVALVVPGACKALGLFGREDDFIIPWECICKIGDDIILIEVSGELKRGRRAKNSWI